MSSQLEPGINDLIKGLPVKERVPVVALRKLMIQRQQIDQEQEQSIAKIKLEYSNKLKPLLERASQIIQGASIKIQELKGAQQFMKPNQNINNYLKGKVIDSYWVSALSNSPLVDQISQNDQKALAFLLDIKNIFPQNTNQNSNVSLKFIFKENPYFNQTIIVRNLRIQNGQVIALDGDQITWKQNKWLTHQKKKITNKKTGQSKIQKGKKIKSFFDVFLDWNIDNQQELQRVSTLMIQLGNMIVMDSLDYFLGLINVDQQSVQDEQQEDDEQEEPQNTKKVKQN